MPTLSNFPVTISGVDLEKEFQTMPAIFNLADFIKIGVLAFVFVFLANRALTMAGLAQYKA